MRGALAHDVMARELREEVLRIEVVGVACVLCIHSNCCFVIGTLFLASRCKECFTGCARQGGGERARVCTDHTLAHPLNCRGGVVARLSA